VSTTDTDPRYAAYTYYADMSVQAEQQIRNLEREVAAGAQCRGLDTEDFYPVSKVAADVLARQQCAGCPVQLQCLELSLLIPAGEHGIWGGRSEEERAVLLRHRRRNAPRESLLAGRTLGRTTVTKPSEAVA
jgi:hypothetical protein